MCPVSLRFSLLLSLSFHFRIIPNTHNNPPQHRQPSSVYARMVMARLDFRMGVCHQFSSVRPHSSCIRCTCSFSISLFLFAMVCVCVPGASYVSPSSLPMSVGFTRASTLRPPPHMTGRDSRMQRPHLHSATPGASETLLRSMSTCVCGHPVWSHVGVGVSYVVWSSHAWCVLVPSLFCVILSVPCSPGVCLSA